MRVCLLLLLLSCAGSKDGEGEEGAEEAEAHPLVGRTFQMDLENATWVEPGEVGRLLVGDLLEHDLHITVLEVAEASLAGRLSFAAQGAQDPCVATTDLPEAAWEKPSFEMPAQDIAFPFPPLNAILPLRDLAVSGKFSADYTTVAEGRAEGAVDARDLGPYLEDQLESTDPQYVCDLLAGFGLSCGPCVSDGEPYCIPFLVEDIGGSEVDTDPASCVEENGCHPDCAQSTCSDPGEGVCE